MKKKKVVSLLLILSLTITSGLSGCGLFPGVQRLHKMLKEIAEESDDDDDSDDDSKDGDSDIQMGSTDYEDMEYQHYDDTEIREMIEECTDLYADEANADAVIEEFDKICDELEIVAQNYTLAELHNYADVDDEYYQDEYSYMDELYTDLSDACCTLGHDILNSPCEDAARAAWDEDDIETFEDYEPMTDEQKDLNKQESDLEIQYNDASAEEFTVKIDGEEHTRDELADLYYDGTIDYQEYLEYYEETYQKENEALGPIYVEMVKVRQQIAESYGYENYSDYAYTEVYDRDYSPEDAASLCKEVKKYLVGETDDLYYAMDQTYYDAINDFGNNMTTDEWMEIVEDHLSDVDPSLEEAFDYMKEYHLYDLEARDNKYDGGFTTLISGYYEPYCFISPGSGFYDVMTLVHEYGHYNAYYQNISDGDSVQNLDLAEIHSQGLEVLYLPYYGEMVGNTRYTETCDEYCLYQKFASVTEGCMYDEFQQQVYALDDPTLEKINDIFQEVSTDYGYSYGSMNQYLWCEVPHNFDSPMYYISYAMSALPALEIWEISTDDYDGAVDTYLELVDAGESGEFLDTLDEVGLTSPFEKGYIKDMADALKDAYDL